MGLLSNYYIRTLPGRQAKVYRQGLTLTLPDRVYYSTWWVYRKVTNWVANRCNKKYPRSY